MNNPIKSLTRREWRLWLASLAVVLIVLWIMASMENSAYIPVAVNFAIFLLNDPERHTYRCAYCDTEKKRSL